MIIRDFQEGDEVVTDLKSEVEANTFTLRWKWPKNSDLVYLYKVNVMQDINFEVINEEDLKLYTKDEYKEFNGYVESIKEISQYKYIVFPTLENDAETVVIKQLDERNQALLCTGKLEIIYNIVEHKRIFSAKKTVKITICSDAPIKKEVLCYVKKQSSYPISIEEGVKFDFITGFHAGENEQQTIEIGRDEYIRVFLKESKDHVNMYTLIRR